MKLVVGLGNPGSEYKKTRHNVGFIILDYYAKNNNASFNKEKLNGLYAEINKNQEKIILLKPQKYMNLSGEVIKKYIDFYKIKLDDILIICDDIYTPLSKYKLRYKGSSGGHNGLKNIEDSLGTNEYKRLKIGVSNSNEQDKKDYVLGNFAVDELKTINSVIEKAVYIIDDFLVLSFEELMSRYNIK